MHLRLRASKSIRVVLPAVVPVHRRFAATVLEGPEVLIGSLCDVPVDSGGACYMITKTPNLEIRLQGWEEEELFIDYRR